MSKYMDIRQRLSSGFSMAEALVSFVLIGLALAATLPLMTQMSQLRTGTDKNTLQCISGNSSTGWYAETTGGTSVPTSGTACNAAVVDAQYNRNKAIETAKWYADHGSAEQITIAKKILRASCDQGGSKACDYFINDCRKNGDTETPTSHDANKYYCDDINSYLDLTYYLHLPQVTTNLGAQYIYEQRKNILSKFPENLINEVIYSNNNNQLPAGGSYSPNQNINNNLAKRLLDPQFLIEGCNANKSKICKEAWDNTNHSAYNRSCSAIKKFWSNAPIGDYKLTYPGDPDENATVQVHCNMKNAGAAAISGCNANSANLEDCNEGFIKGYNRTCAEIFRQVGPDEGNYRLSKSTTPDEDLTTCEAKNNCIESGIGTQCDDGTIYAGVVNNQYIFAAPVSQSSSIAWASIPIPSITVAQMQSSDGKAMTDILLSIPDYDPTKPASSSNDFFAPYKAAHQCKALNDKYYKGHNDWYLPSYNEMNVVMAKKAALGMGGDRYWTTRMATSTNSEYYRVYSFQAAGSMYYDRLHDINSVRCVRKSTTKDSSCTTLASRCTDGSLYAGVYNSRYMYVPPIDQESTSWGRGEESYSFYIDLNLNDNYDGAGNTNMLTTAPVNHNANAPYKAAELCNSLNNGQGTSYDGGNTYYNDWYLPANEEAKLLCLAKDTGKFAGTFGTNGLWSSTETGNYGRDVYAIDLSSSTCSNIDSYDSWKDHVFEVRCVRKFY